MVNHQSPDGGNSANCMKVFVQRDYSDGTSVRFSSRFPTELEGKVSFTPFFVTTIDRLYVLSCINHT